MGREMTSSAYLRVGRARETGNLMGGGWILLESGEVLKVRNGNHLSQVWQGGRESQGCAWGVAEVNMVN